MFIQCWSECKMVHPHWTIVWQFLKQSKLPYHPPTPLLVICPRDIKTVVHTDFHADVYSSVVHNSQKMETA